MIEPTTLTVSGERFLARYDFTGDQSTARERAERLCVEQTIEFPADLVGDDDIRRHVIGRIETLAPIAEGVVRAEISYAVETSAHELTQILNVLFGNSSLLPDVKLVGIELTESLVAHLPGPRFGIPGLRDLLDAPDRPLVATALKPMGLSAGRFGRMAGEFAMGGMDIIKDDHGLSNQPFAPFEDRVRAAAEAVRAANDRTGGRTLYMPTMNGPHEQLDDRLAIALDAGVGGLLVLPGLTGFDHLRHLASRDDVAIPLMGHPAFLGGFVSSPTGGIAHATLFGTLMRVAGADVSVFPTHGGRFAFSPEACTSISEACREPLDQLRPIFPTPAGGMTRDRVTDVVSFYGPDTVLLIGGNLHREDDLVRSARAVRDAVG